MKHYSVVVDEAPSYIAEVITTLYTFNLHTTISLAKYPSVHVNVLGLLVMHGDNSIHIHRKALMHMILKLMTQETFKKTIVIIIKIIILVHVTSMEAHILMITTTI